MSQCLFDSPTDAERSRYLTTEVAVFAAIIMWVEFAGMGVWRGVVILRFLFLPFVTTGSDCGSGSNNTPSVE